jgi:hypothetical protein
MGYQCLDDIPVGSHEHGRLFEATATYRRTLAEEYRVSLTCNISMHLARSFMLRLMSVEWCDRFVTWVVGARTRAAVNTCFFIYVGNLKQFF